MSQTGKYANGEIVKYKCIRCHTAGEIEIGGPEYRAREEWNVEFSEFRLCTKCASEVAYKRFICSDCGRPFMMKLSDYLDYTSSVPKEEKSRISCSRCNPNVNDIECIAEMMRLEEEEKRMRKAEKYRLTKLKSKPKVHSECVHHDYDDDIPEILRGPIKAPKIRTLPPELHRDFMIEYDAIIDLSKSNWFRKAAVARKYGLSPEDAESYFWRSFILEVISSMHVLFD